MSTAKFPCQPYAMRTERRNQVHRVGRSEIGFTRRAVGSIMNASMHPGTPDFDFIVIGSGFGGSVSALRLTEKGYRVALLEMGRRWTAKDFPTTNWKIWRW